MDYLSKLISATHTSEDAYDELEIESERVAHHRKIYDIIHQEILPKQSQEFPRLDVIAYTFQTILRPVFTAKQIPDILNLLPHVEFWRKYALDEIEAALTWQTLYLEEPNKFDRDGRALNPGEEQQLTRHKERSHHGREMYLLLIRNLISLHIYHLFTGTDSAFLPKQLAEYFPNYNQRETGGLATSKFIHDLSDDEHAKFQKLHEECIAWLTEAFNEERARFERLSERGLTEEEIDNTFQADFKSTHPPPVDILDLRLEIEAYLKNTEEIVARLLRYFSS